MSSAWTRKPPGQRNWPYDDDEYDVDDEPSKFDYYSSIDMDVDTKLAVLKASPSIVSLVPHTGLGTKEKRLRIMKRKRKWKQEEFEFSGTIIECQEESNGTFCSTILTSASLIRNPSGELGDIKVDVYLSGGQLFEGHMSTFDYHYNISVIEIRSPTPLPTAILRHFDDSMPLRPIALHGHESSSFQLGHHVDKAVDSNSNLFKICPGDMVVALGRRYRFHKLMAASGEFSVGCCDFDCQELFMASCKMTRNGIGGALINRFGEVIGINFYHKDYTPFLPINIVSKCLEVLKKHGRVHRPWLGMEVSSLYAASVSTLESIVKKFPNISKGVIVEKVISKSPADCAGIHHNDVIVQCDGHDVGCFLEFFEILWDKAGESVEVVVMRRGFHACLNLTMFVDETSPDNYYKWPVRK